MKRKLSVLIVSPHPQTQGGVSTYVETLKKHLRDCDVVPFWVGAPPQHKENPLQLLLRLLIAPLQVAWRAHRKQIDVVHINPSLDKKSLLRDGLIMLALILSGYHRIIIFFHGWDRGLSDFIARHIVARKLFVFCLNQSARVVVLAPEFKMALADIGVERVAVSRTMVDLLTYAAPKNNSRRQILFMSRFDKRKGVYELLDAFASLANQFPDCDLVMAGDGMEAATLKEHVAKLKLENRVTFPGYVAGEAKAILLRQCTLFALPTYYPEGMPIAVLEAMAAGKPLLTTQAGGLKNIVFNSENGVVLDSVTTETVAAGLRRLLSDATFCAKAGQRNAVVARQFDAAIVTAEIEAIYHDIAARHE